MDKDMEKKLAREWPEEKVAEELSDDQLEEVIGGVSKLSRRPGFGGAGSTCKPSIGANV